MTHHSLEHIPLYISDMIHRWRLGCCLSVCLYYMSLTIAMAELSMFCAREQPPKDGGLCGSQLSNVLAIICERGGYHHTDTSFHRLEKRQKRGKTCTLVHAPNQ